MQKKIERVVMIGAGNVATHLAMHLSKFVKIEGILSKTKTSAEQLASKIGTTVLTSISEIPSCDLVLICTNDSSISPIEEEISATYNVAYTSGSIELKKSNRRTNFGVIYPLQTFSKERELSLSDVPFFIEATNDEFGKQLFELALLLSTKVSYATSIERKKLHISAVFINNFVNHLAYIANNFVESQNLNWEHLNPLLQETVYKLQHSSPKDAQTGPARRNDTVIIQEHLKLLEGYPKEIYKLLSESIMDTYSKKNEHDQLQRKT